MKTPSAKRNIAVVKPIRLDSSSSELIRRIRATSRTHASAVEACRRGARLLWAFRRAGVPIPKEGSTYRAYCLAVGQRQHTGHLLERLQRRYKRLYGRVYKERRSRLRYTQDRYKQVP